MCEEMESMHNTGTWKLVNKPENAKIIGSKWIFRIKEDSTPTDPPRFKARLVAKGFNQREGIDYNEIFAPVVKYKTLRLLLVMTTVYDWELHQMDVKTAFLHGNLNETIYMSQPPGFIDKTSPNHVCMLQKSIYGLKQSLRQWNIKFNSCMLALGFMRSKYDACLYLKRPKPDLNVYLLLYVDDILIMSNSKTEVEKMKRDFKANFDMKDLGLAKRILGISITRDRKNKKMYLSQHDYFVKVLDKFAMNCSRPTAVPLGGHLMLTKDDCPKTKTEQDKMANIPYDVDVGSVMYCMLCTRPDLPFGISVLSRFMSNPGEPDWLAMKYLLKYMCGTKSLGLVYSGYGLKSELFGYVDSDYTSNRDNRKSTSEYIADTEAAKEALWLKGLLLELENECYVPIVFTDSQSALHLCHDPVYHERSKHIDVRLHFIRDKIEMKEFETKKILGDVNPADFGTKVMPTNKFEFCRNFLHIEEAQWDP
ncbi:unnamed protein product [Rhodiola kirilowii]